MIVFVKNFQTLGKIREHFNDAPGLVYCFDVIHEATFYYADGFFEFLNLFLLLLQALLIDGVALNQMFLENAVGPDAELGSTLRVNPVTD